MPRQRLHGHSPGSFHLVQAAFERPGMIGLLDKRPGGAVQLAQLSREVLVFHRERPGASGAEPAVSLEAALGLRLHRRTARRR